MVEPNTDRRVKRTKRMIRDALSDLLEAKGFDEITVTDICIRADINRGTFYLHYQDKYDLLEQSEDEIIQEIKEKARNAIQSMDLLNDPVIDQPLPFVVKIIESFKEHAVFIKAILGPRGTPSFRLKLKGVFIANLKLIKKSKQESKLNTLVPEKYLVSYIAGAHIGVIQQWLDGGMKETPQEIALFLSKMTGMGPAYAAGLRK